MSGQESAEIKAQVSSINAIYKQPQVSFMTPSPPAPMMPEIKQDYVTPSLMPPADEIRHHNAPFAVIIRKEDARRLDLMVGDTITIKITKS
jgi:hypothetical protein